MKKYIYQHLAMCIFLGIIYIIIYFKNYNIIYYIYILLNFPKQYFNVDTVTFSLKNSKLSFMKFNLLGFYLIKIYEVCITTAKDYFLSCMHFIIYVIISLS